jgi:hypothetical protein
MEHFREALRLDPELDWARAGIVEALKAKHLIYRLMLRYFLWMAKLSHTAQWAIILGGYFGQQYLSKMAAKDPKIAPFVLPIIAVYIVFVLLTWLADPLFNLLLRLNRFGRLALSRDQIFASNCIGICLLLAVGSAAYWLIAGSELAMYGALFAGLLMIPVAGTFNCQKGWPRYVMAGYTLLLVLVGIWSLYVTFPKAAEFNFSLNIFLLGTFVSSFVANGLTMARVKQ